MLVGTPLGGDFRRVDVRLGAGAIAEMSPDLEQSDSEVVDATSAFVIPGFVDAHQHMWEASLRGVITDSSIEDFFFRVHGHHSGAHSPEDLAAGIAAGALASIDAGTTTVLEHARRSLTRPRRSRARSRPRIRAEDPLVLRHDRPAARGARVRPAERPLTPRTRDAHPAFAAQSDEDVVTMGLAIADVGATGWDTVPVEYRLADELDVWITSHGMRPDPPAGFIGWIASAVKQQPRLNATSAPRARALAVATDERGSRRTARGS